MNKYKRKREIRKRLYSKPVLFLLIVIFAFVAHGVWGIYTKSKQSDMTLQVAEAELEALEMRKENISKKIERLGTETGLEEEIRGKYDLAKEGEHIIVIVDKEEELEVEEDRPTGIKGIFATVSSWFQ